MSNSTSSAQKDVHEMNVYQLRGHISRLLRTDFCNRLNELERLMNEAMNLLLVKESSPPRSDWWDLRVLIEKANQSNYNKVNNSETLGCVYCALNLKTVGHPDEIALSCRNDKAIYGGLVTHLADFTLKNFPEDMSILCKNAFGTSVQSFEFFVKVKITSRNTAEQGDWTDTALMLTARAKLNALIIEVEELKGELQELIDKTLPQLREILKDPLETYAGSDSEESEEEDEEALDEEGKADNPSRKRRKTLGEIGMSKDTWRQQVSNFGIQISPGQAVKNTRTREFRGNPEPHYANVLGAWATGFNEITSKTLPVPRAPTFSRGAEGTQDTAFKLICPGEDVNCDTSVTQKMMDEDAENNTNLVLHYETMHDLANRMGKKMNEVVKSYNESFDFVVRVHHDTSFGDFSVNNMSWMQKLAIGRLYLDAISVNKGVEEEEEDEEEEGEEEGEEDGESDASFDSDDDDDDDDDDEDGDSDASADEDNSDED